MLCAHKKWARLLKQYPLTRTGGCYCYSSSGSNNGSKTGSATGHSEDGGGKNSSSLSSYNETYKKLDSLDFTTAAKILFSEPPKKKRFGFDFHLVQFFFACMPSLAVYLVAQYARYEMRKMEAEQEEKKKQQEEEEKAKAVELEAAEQEKEAGAKREIQEVKERLDKLEQTVRDVVVEAKNKSPTSSLKKEDAAVGKQSQESPGSGASNKGSEP
ncbi:uncharacterized protein LOC116198071 [Punica granatum]|uniref:Protein MNN4-like n=2 Tax=Punica granatum TaxID=22663 RepID=A0A218XE87_PUNGR|nr:uncharacterized protein LOC116198071 [Punica granatum]XP_031384244.1 uncharacterized protein LOC116198071 [Punica granatum]OWM83118.1 hypothetical protein CDL15_Pgr011800 [Punica granatum]PKI33871.1 hypothetical protein CRG98_045742 [Punica granatum]